MPRQLPNAPGLTPGSAWPNNGQKQPLGRKPEGLHARGLFPYL